MHVLKKALKDKGTGKPGGINKTYKSQETLETYKFTASLSRLNKQQKFLEREDSVSSQVAFKLYRELQGHRFSKSSPYRRGLFHDTAVHLCVIHVARSEPLPKLRLGTPIIRLVYQGGLDGFIPLVCYGCLIWSEERFAHASLGNVMHKHASLEILVLYHNLVLYITWCYRGLGRKDIFFP